MVHLFCHFILVEVFTACYTVHLGTLTLLLLPLPVGPLSRYNEGISLKRRVVQRGSILLAELVAILMVFEHCIAALKDGFTDIKILSDSQTAVVILTPISFPAILAWPGIQDRVVRIPYLINVPIFSLMSEIVSM
jgi:hypothetical protein